VKGGSTFTTLRDCIFIHPAAIITNFHYQPSISISCHAVKIQLQGPFARDATVSTQRQKKAWS
jgi:hypothetical protein